MKKSVIMIPVLVFAAVSTIVYGQRYSAKQREEMDSYQLSVSDSENDKTEVTEDDYLIDASEETDPQKKLAYYESNQESLSLYEYLDYISMKKETVSLAYYGDITMQEDWVAYLNNTIDESVSGDLAVIDQTYSDYDSYELYIQQTTQSLTSEAPDLILFGLPAHPDQRRDMGLEETEEFMGYVLDRLASSEDTKLIMLEPYPIINEINQINSRSLDYRSYLRRMQSVGEDYDLTVLPLHSVFEEQALDDSLTDYYKEDGELNDKGSDHVFSILDDLFSEEL
ncbi:MAG: hypothetical protein U5K84_09205 [Alkalibacterium sp.]|nr:hypothetical protein [Alkalibacterium sp.]